MLPQTDLSGVSRHNVPPLTDYDVAEGEKKEKGKVGFINIHNEGKNGEEDHCQPGPYNRFFIFRNHNLRLS